MGVRLVAAVVGVLCAVPYAWASEVVEAPIRTVSMFKNGLAVITREIEVDGPGTYVLEHAPTAVHGTFWVESDAVVTTRTITRRIEVPLDPSAGQNLREELTGRMVTVRTADDDDVTYSGRVVALTPGAGDQQWSRSYEAIQRYWWSYPTYNTSSRPTQTRSGAIILDSGNERHYIMPDRIASVTVHNPTDTMMRMQPVLEFRVEEPDGDESASDGTRMITLTYLTKGITWAPAYLTRLGEDGRVELVQQATIRNELESIDGAEFFLISGFPNIEFSHVDGLNSPAATIAGFFSQLNQQVSVARGRRSEAITQQVVYNTASPGSSAELDLGGLADVGSSDLHYQPIGSVDLEAGASVVLRVVSGEAEYKRFVDWKIADTRDVYGRPIQEYNQYTGQRGAPQPSDPWDAVRFRNPLGFPMTTAAMMVLDGGKFAGQNMSYWTNPGEPATARLTKALSVRTEHVEYEREGARRDTKRHHHTGWIATVDVEIRVVNYRATAIDLEVRREFSGELLESDLEPASNRLLETGTHSFNPRRELKWSLSMEPGEERVVKFSYEVFVRK